MRQSLWPFVALMLWCGNSSCTEKEAADPNQTCPDEHVLEVYQNRLAVVVGSDGVFSLIVDSTDIARGSYAAQNYLVPATPIPAQYQVAGKRMRLTGRKKSCYGLITSPYTRTLFGYKLEVDQLEEESPTPRR